MSHSSHSSLSLCACLGVPVCPVCFLWEHMDDSAHSSPLDVTVNIASCVLVFVCVQWEPALQQLFALLCAGVCWGPLSPEAPSPCTLTHLNLFFSFVAAEDPPGKWQPHADTHSVLCRVLEMLGLHFQDEQELWAPLVPALPAWIPWPGLFKSGN